MTLSPRALSPEAQALFDEAREASEQPDAGVPDDARGRMRANVLAAAAAGGVTAAATAAKAAGAAGTTKAAATATGASGAGKAMMWLGSLSTGKMVIGFVAAAGLTLGGLTVLDPQPPREAIAPTPSATAVAAPADEPETNVDAAPAAEPSRIDEAEQTARAEPTTARPTPGAPAPSASTETLEEQAALLMRARDAIRQGRHGQAQRLLDSYRERYGKGALGEEQEALGVLNMCGRGDPWGVEAAKHFADKYPGSPLLKRIEQGCR